MDRRLAQMAEQLLRSRGHATTLVDLRERPLPPFDNDTVYRDPHYTFIHQAIREADGVFLGVPVYNRAVGSVAKNLLEATGATDATYRKAAWFDQVVTFLCAGGLPHSRTAYSNLALSLMLDFRCIVNSYLVYTTSRDWDGQNQLSAPLRQRLEKTVQVKVELATCLRQRRYSSDWEL